MSQVPIGLTLTSFVLPSISSKFLLTHPLISRSTLFIYLSVAVTILLFVTDPTFRLPYDDLPIVGRPQLYKNVHRIYPYTWLGDLSITIGRFNLSGMPPMRHNPDISLCIGPTIFGDLYLSWTPGQSRSATHWPARIPALCALIEGLTIYGRCLC